MDKLLALTFQTSILSLQLVHFQMDKAPCTLCSAILNVSGCKRPFIIMVRCDKDLEEE